MHKPTASDEGEEYPTPTPLQRIALRSGRSGLTQIRDVSQTYPYQMHPYGVSIGRCRPDVLRDGAKVARVPLRDGHLLIVVSLSVYDPERVSALASEAFRQYYFDVLAPQFASALSGTSDSSNSFVSSR
jgi:hypothetical protein